MSCIVKTTALMILALLVVFCQARPGPIGKTAGQQPRVPSLEEVQQHIDEMGYCWTAGWTSVSSRWQAGDPGLGKVRLPEDYSDILKQIRRRPQASPLMDLPARFDWGDSSVVPPIREQLCGDCWAQSVVAAMECQLRIRDYDSTALAVQHVIDCNFGESNCAGGFLVDACYLYALLGSVSEECYPYLGTDANCHCDTCGIVAKLAGYRYIDTTVVSLKTHLMADGPIPVALTVPPDLQYYTGGCYESEEQGEWWHALTIIGWEDSMCAGQGAWHVWNSSGTDWGEDGFAWFKYGTCSIGAGAMVLDYTSKGPVQLALGGLTVDDTSGDSDGLPDPGESVVLAMELANEGWLTATGVGVTLSSTTPGVIMITDTATFPDIDPDTSAQSNPPHLAFSVGGDMLCGTPAKFTVSIGCDQGDFTESFELVVGDAEIVFTDDAEEDLGWTLGVAEDDATGGRWRRKNPTGTEADSILVQPEFDHTPGSGVKCFLTSNTLRNLDPGAADVDGGKTTLLSPPIDLSDRASAFLRYWRWYTNDTGGNPDDSWAVDISPDSGTTWHNLESDSTSERSWIQREFDLHCLIPLTGEVIVRFVASDYGDESIVEAAVDDFEILGCPHTVDVLPPSVTILSPNGGEEITEGTDFEITWSAYDDYGMRDMLVLASYDSGMTYSDTLGNPLWPDTTLSWHVPAGEYSHCSIRVEITDRGYNPAGDVSDSTFSIVRDLSGIEETSPPVPVALEMFASESNPFAGSTRISFGIPAPTRVRMSVYDVKGRLVRVLLDSWMEAGYHSAIWDGKSASAGPVSPAVYFVHLRTPQARKTAKVVLMR